MSQIVDIQHLTEEQKKFLSKVIKDENGCWIWQSSKNKITGYGIAVSNRKMVIAHRLSYRLFKDTIPLGLVVHHLCHVKLCVNPDHLQIMTQTENLKQSDGLYSNSICAHNSKKTHCPRGHEYTKISTKGRTRRVCLLCREASHIHRKNEFSHIDPNIIRENLKRFKQPELLKSVNDTSIDLLVSQGERNFGPGNFKAAVKTLLLLQGVNCYSKHVTYAQRFINNTCNNDVEFLIQLAIFLKIKPTKFRYRNKK